MNEPQIFNFGDNEVRTILVEDTPYFVANDVAKVLGYTNPSKATKDHCKKPIFTRGNDSLGRLQEFKAIPESDVYRLVIKSKMPNAEKFEEWVMEEVLPSIRKTGSYGIQAPKTFKEALQLALMQEEKIEELNKQNLIAEQKINELQPKADYYDNILNNKGLVTVSTIAKNYGMSAVAFNKLLHELGVQYSQSGTWLLYSKYQNKAYTHIEPFDYCDSNGFKQVKTRTKWTQKGHIFIYQLLKENDVLPMIEKQGA